MGGVLTQFDMTRQMCRPVAFYSARHSGAECNYDIHDKELLGSRVSCLETSSPIPILASVDCCPRRVARYEAGIKSWLTNRTTAKPLQRAWLVGHDPRTNHNLTNNMSRRGHTKRTSTNGDIFVN